MRSEDHMEFEQHLTIAVADWLTKRAQVMREIELEIYRAFSSSVPQQSTGVFSATIAVPMIPSSVEKPRSYWCCAADYGEHEVTCKNYIPKCTRDHVCGSGPCNGMSRTKL